jgi:hypothetical protein
MSLTHYEIYFLSADAKQVGRVVHLGTDQSAVSKAQAERNQGKTVKVYAEVPGQLKGRVVWDSEINPDPKEPT